MKAKTALRLVGNIAVLIRYADTRDEKIDLEDLLCKLCDDYDVLKKKDFMMDVEEVCQPLMDKKEQEITEAVKSAMAEDDEEEDDEEDDEIHPYTIQPNASITEMMRTAEAQVGTVLERDLVKIVRRDGKSFATPFGAIVSEIPACTRGDASEILKAMQLDMAEFAIIPYDFYLDPVTGEISRQSSPLIPGTTVVGRNDGKWFWLPEKIGWVTKVLCANHDQASALLSQLPNQAAVRNGEFYLHVRE